MIAVLAGLWWYECTGPRAEIEEVSLEEPSQPGHPYQASAVVRNNGRNEGEVTVVFRLTGDDGRTFAGHQSVGVKGHDRVIVVTEINAPSGNYQVEAKVEYPPQ